MTTFHLRTDLLHSVRLRGDQKSHHQIDYFRWFSHFKRFSTTKSFYSGIIRSVADFLQANRYAFECLQLLRQFRNPLKISQKMIHVKSKQSLSIWSKKCVHLVMQLKYNIKSRKKSLAKWKHQLNFVATRFRTTLA